MKTTVLERSFGWARSILGWLLLLLFALWFGGWGRGLLMEPISGSLPATELAQLQGGQPRQLIDDGNQLVYLFAPWCTVCKFTFGHIGQWQQQGRRVQAVALSYRSIDEVRQFVAEYGQQPQTVFLADRAWSDHMDVVAFPTYLIVDSSGKLIAKRVGYLPEWALSLYLYWHNV